MRTYRAAIIGCGRIGADCDDKNHGSSRLACHAECYASSPRTHLVAACDPDPSRRRRVAERWGIPRLYANHQDLLTRENVEVVSICTSAATHADILLDVLDAGVSGVLIEKPLARRLDEADKLILRARDARTVVAVNYIRRSCPSYRQAAKKLWDGRLGRIQVGQAIYTKGILNNGTHLLDLLRFFFGDPSEIRPLSFGRGGEVDPTVSFRVNFPAGFCVWVQGLDHESFSVFELDLIGTHGRMIFRELGHTLDVYDVEDSMAAHGFRQLVRTPTSTATGLAGAIGYAINDLLDSVERGLPPVCTLDDGRAALALADEVLKDVASRSVAQE